MDNKQLRYCSVAMKQGYEFLDDYVREEIDGFDYRDASAYYALDLVDSTLSENVIKSSLQNNFVNDQTVEYTEDVDKLYHLCKLYSRRNIGWQENPWLPEYMESMVNEQAKSGEFLFGQFRHGGPLRLLNIILPESDAVSDGITFLLQYSNQLSHPGLTCGLLALSEKNFSNYRSFIQSASTQIIEQDMHNIFRQNPEDMNYTSLAFRYSYLTVTLLSRLSDFNREIERGLDFVKSLQNEDGGWGSAERFDRTPMWETAAALLALHAGGEGPKVSRRQAEWQKEVMDQRRRDSAPEFVRTVPVVGVREIEECMKSAIRNTQSELRIISPYVDMLQKDIIDLSERDTGIEIKIVTKPKGNFQRNRAGLAKKVVDLLHQASNRSVRTNEHVHSRMLVVDTNSVLVSSADLTRDQLYERYNTGLQTGDPNTVRASIDFFEEVWLESDELQLG